MPDNTESGWQQLSLTIKGAALEQVEAVLYQLGALAITLKDAADQPLLEPAPGELPLWDNITVDALFEQSTHPELLITALNQALSELDLSTLKTEFVKDQAWERAWMDRFQPMCFGKRLWIYPTHIPPANPNLVNVLLDPGLAFGSGTHPTTALCLQWLDQQPLDGKTIIDYGCGSGVLAIAACKLGAKHAYACDIDAQALTATRANAELNGVSDRMTVLTVKELGATQADIVLANILSNILIAIAAPLTGHAASNAQLVLSGILAEQANAVEDAYKTAFEFSVREQKEEWLLLAGTKR